MSTRHARAKLAHASRRRSAGVSRLAHASPVRLDRPAGAARGLQGATMVWQSRQSGLARPVCGGGRSRPCFGRSARRRAWSRRPGRRRVFVRRDDLELLLATRSCDPLREDPAPRLIGRVGEGSSTRVKRLTRQPPVPDFPVSRHSVPGVDSRQFAPFAHPPRELVSYSIAALNAVFAPPGGRTANRAARSRSGTPTSSFATSISDAGTPARSARVRCIGARLPEACRSSTR